jgi:hypothetical protein
MAKRKIRKFNVAPKQGKPKLAYDMRVALERVGKTQQREMKSNSLEFSPAITKEQMRDYSGRKIFPSMIQELENAEQEGLVEIFQDTYYLTEKGWYEVIPEINNNNFYSQKVRKRMKQRIAERDKAAKLAIKKQDLPKGTNIRTGL